MRPETGECVNKQQNTKEKQYSLDIYTTPLQEEERSETQENRSGQTHRNILHIQILPKSYLQERVRFLRHPINKLVVRISYMMFVPVSMRPMPKNRMLRKPKSWGKITPLYALNIFQSETLTNNAISINPIQDSAHPSNNLISTNKPHRLLQHLLLIRSHTAQPLAKILQ